MDLERYRSIISDWTAFNEAALRPEPTVFRVRWGRIEERVLLDRLAAQGFRTHPLEGMPGFHQVDEGPRPLAATVEHWQGYLYIQQASTGVAAPALGPRRGERVLDLCAAPGGKTTHMAELMEDSGCLVASEISESRIRGLLGNVYRLGHTNVMVVAGDGRDFPAGALFDRVLVDAPCSGEGTLRRRGGRAPRQSPSFQGYVTGAQRSLLERAVRLTRPGGTVLYVTCTFAPEENEAVVSDALARLPVELEPLSLPVPCAPGVTSFESISFDPRVEGAARIYPHHLDSGGLFLAKLTRLEERAKRGDGATGAIDGADTTDVRGRDPERVGGAVMANGDDSGWGPVGPLLPEELIDAEGSPALAPDDDGDVTRQAETAGARALIESGVTDLRERYGVAGDTEGPGAPRWLIRGGRAWLHTLDAWPLPAWEIGAWRPISVGLRAIEFDTLGRPRPTNDAIRWLGSDVTRRIIDLDDDALSALLRRIPVETELDDRGPYALRYDGDLIGRGAVTGEGLKSEIPKARAADLRRCLPDLPEPPRRAT